ncbi:DNA/RNA non-specific endonuclease [uncultured Adlercreutzia sp.]|uniref:DNA/RNA non-specific endonuclease n=2 Tax=uncultured Adlercreutzia sp. TaxID=875803 RepID=UPI00266D618F|nr:DNA/RNA non-specific endonuclease [uncultured Adlercreutzia sp.]
MPQRSPQQENHTPVIGIALTLLLSIALATGCSASTAGNEAPPGEPTPELASTGTPDGPQEPQSAPAEDTNQQETEAVGENRPVTDDGVLSYRDVPAFEGNPYVYVNDGEPTFTDEQRAAEPGHEHYGELDELGRCTAAFAVVGPETQPTEKRGSIGEIRPSGWQMAKYDFVEGKYLFNRCHLLGYQLTGENANPQNLITGTRYLNVQGMLPFENAVADYVDATGNHVLMAVTPVFEGSELVARGVRMMAESVEDGGEGVAFNVFCYNVQPGVVIDYGTGASMLEEDATPLPDVSGAESAPDAASEGAGAREASEKGATGSDEGKGVAEYVLNTNSRKFHLPSCSSVGQMSPKNREDVEDTRENLIANGYDPCKRCNP